MIYVWLSRLLYQAPAGPQQRAALSARRLRGPESTERSLTPVDVGVRVRGRGEEPARTNETSLSVCGLHHPTKRKMCVRERTRNCVSWGVCGAWVQCLYAVCENVRLQCLFVSRVGVFQHLLYPLTAI